ncbi:cyanophycinase [Paracoccus benzoatiresistens]|uniref:Cyanophycinase n=1 Tax=Paracoccus benzoatiresistens TaxID=2997341 RepID=A0ABT4JB86_9RHOB|nr:cyanophycinase [Paracoccus sp. EF6]MCZ0963593.1 cyanophycinase [Paracoccus sp. EF6]
MTNTFQDGSSGVPTGSPTLLRIVASATAVPDWADSQAPAAGALVAVGGAAKVGIYADLLQLYGRPRPKILIIPHARPAKDHGAVFKLIGKLFAAAGASDIERLDLSRIAHARAQIAHADIIWMSGGSQGRLLIRLRRAGLIKDIRRRFALGRGIIAGSSAGASILSDIMIETSQRVASGPGDPVLSRGLGLWHDAIIDQHFSERGRLERLVRAIETHPDLVGIGIDEDTGFVRFGDGRTRVIGTGTVTILRAAGHETGPAAIEAPRPQRDRIAAPR